MYLYSLQIKGDSNKKIFGRARPFVPLYRQDILLFSSPSIPALVFNKHRIQGTPEALSLGVK
jgi:hypothetical protein